MAANEKVRTTSGRGRLYDSVLDTVGDTPCIRVSNLAPGDVRVYVKVEAFNPASSVKDRLAVKRQEVVSRTSETTDRRSAADSEVRAVPVVVMRPALEHGGALR